MVFDIQREMIKHIHTSTGRQFDTGAAYTYLCLVDMFLNILIIELFGLAAYQPLPGNLTSNFVVFLRTIYVDIDSFLQTQKVHDSFNLHVNRKQRQKYGFHKRKKGRNRFGFKEIHKGRRRYGL